MACVGVTEGLVLAAVNNMCVGRCLALMGTIGRGGAGSVAGTVASVS